MSLPASVHPEGPLSETPMKRIRLKNAERALEYTIFDFLNLLKSFEALTKYSIFIIFYQKRKPQI